MKNRALAVLAAGLALGNSACSAPGGVTGAPDAGAQASYGAAPGYGGPGPDRSAQTAAQSQQQSQQQSPPQAGAGQGPGPRGGPGYGPGPGWGWGMMGGGPWPGCGPGMMGRGYGGWPGMMGAYGWGMRLQNIPDLSDEQRSRIGAIQNDLAQKQSALMQTMHQNFGGTMYRGGRFDEQEARKAYAATENLRRQMFENHIEARKRIDAVLTPRQREQLQRAEGNR